VDLLVYDERNPRALAFQWRAINTLLIELAESLGTRPQDALYGPISQLIAIKYTPLGSELELSTESRTRFAAGLESLNAAGAALSEQLTSQHFSHVDYEVGAVSA
jgi:uncharacterized alpha-E superfamily protein